MKKTILFAIMMMAVCSANAQLTIDSLGIAYITHGTYRSHKAYFNMNGPNELLYCYMQANTNETFVPAGEFFSTNDGTGNILGLSAVGWGNNNNDYAIGIRGKARALNGRGVGTFGCLSTRTNKGAGILGSNNLLGYSYIDSLLSR